MAFNSVDNSYAKSLEYEWKVPNPGLIDALIEQQIEGGANALKLYDGDSHRHIFALTKPLRRYMEQDERIMTIDNPVFMY